MPSPYETLLCLYHYDALDRLTSQIQTGKPQNQRFYCERHLVTEIQGKVRHSIFQQEDLLLAQQRSDDSAIGISLLAADQKRSVLHTFKANQRKAIVYSPYGHRPAENELLHSPGFNGDRPDSVTGCYLLGNGNRVFNPVLMRFLSPDSMSPFGKGGFNPYAYCSGDPTNFSDPSGNNAISKLVSRGFQWVKKKLGIKTTKGAFQDLSPTAIKPPTLTRPTNHTRPRSNSAPSLTEPQPSTADLENWDLIGFHGSTDRHTASLISGLDPKQMGSGAGLRFGRGFYLAPVDILPKAYGKNRVMFGSAKPQLFTVHTKNFNRLKAGRDFSFHSRKEFPIERRFLEIVVRERAYNSIVVQAAELRGRVVLPKPYEAPF